MVYGSHAGALHQLLGIRTAKELLSHPKVGASWEGFVLEQVLAAESYDEAYFWATHQGAEMDLVLRREGRSWGVECKRADAPKLSPSIRIALQDLGLQRVAVVYPGATRYPLSDAVEAVPLDALANGERLFPDSA
jgi:predicted AAA+ superfamily ATPase